METVIIGCRLPQGLTIEVGFQTAEKDGSGRLRTSVRKLPNYRRYTLKGTAENLKKNGILLPAQLRPEPFFNTAVPKDIWDEWFKAHQHDWAVKSGNVFLVKDKSDMVAHVTDAASVPAPFAPLDPSKAIVVGVETADFKAA